MTNFLKKGHRGTLVRELQGHLNTLLGAFRLKPDGDFGANTDAAVKEIQTTRQLKADGIVGPNTWASIRQGSSRGLGAFGIDLFDNSILNAFFDSLNDAISWDLNSKALAHKTPAAKSDNKNFRRIHFAGYAGQGYVIQNFKKFEDGAIQLLPKVVIIDKNEPVPNTLRNECAQFVQYFGVPRTHTWRRGPRVCDFKQGELPEGTVIATLRDGKYYSDYSGRSHVGIYLSHDNYEQYLKTGSKAAGILMMDQFNGNPILSRPIKYYAVADSQGNPAKKSWKDASGLLHKNRVNWTKDGEEYYVLLVE